MKYRFFTCDVFTETRFGGNQLAVLPDARGLSDVQMQAITREFNYSESTFVFPPERGGTRNVRIFTPSMEVPFAGHPNIGTAFVLASAGELGAATNIVFEEKAGDVAISIARGADGRISCELRAPQKLSLGRTLGANVAAEALGLAEADVLTSAHQPVFASVGLPFNVIELASRDALARARPVPGKFEALHYEGYESNAHIYFRDVDCVRTRMFFDFGATIIEDPATGSANCALAGLLSQLDARPDGDFAYRILQGVELGRPSVLHARTRKIAGRVSDIWIGGSSVLVSEGEICVD